MKKFYTLFLLLFLCMNFSFAQNEALKPTVSYPVYFDISPPLRDMVQKSDAIIDQSWKEGIVKNKRNTFSNDNSIPDNNYVDPVHQFTFGDATSDTTIQNYDGVSANGSWPPDTDGDVGLSNYMQVVNTKFAVYDKNGVKLLGPSNNSTIFNGLPNNGNDGDAILLYDENADRWLFSQFSLPNYPNGPFYENVAISQTNDPTGTWYRYQFTFPNMPDYPKLSVWQDGYYMTARMFASGTGNWIGPSAMALDRTKMLVGDLTAGMVTFTLPSSSEGPQPADCDSDFPPAGTPCPVCYLSASTAKIYDFHVDWTTPANSTFALNVSVPITSFAYFGNSNYITQKGTSQKLDPMSGKRIMFRMPFRKFSDHWSMLLSTTVSLSGVAGIRWMEMRNIGGTWSLYQEGTYAPTDANHRWMGSIAMDAVGDIALGFSISSTTMYPSIRYTGRLSCDPLGEMTIAEKGITNGGGSQTSSDGRWGDYSAMCADPSVPGKFWYTQEYYTTTSGTNWKTRIGSFSFANVMTLNVNATPSAVCADSASQLDAMACGASGTYTYSWTSNPAGFTSTLQNPVVNPHVNTTYIVEVNGGSQSKIDSVQVTVIDAATANAGNDTIVCWYVSPIVLNGTATFYNSVLWTTSGDGTFSSDNSLITNYLPGMGDKTSGSVNLTLSVVPVSACVPPVASVKHVTLDPCTGIQETSSNELTLAIQPNPAHGTVTITLDGLKEKAATLTINGMDGKALYSSTITAMTKKVIKTIDLSGYAKGIYSVQVMTNGQIQTKQLVVQ